MAILSANAIWHWREMADDPITQTINEWADDLTTGLTAGFNAAGSILRKYGVEAAWLMAMALTYGGIFLLTGRDPVVAAAILFVGIMILLYFGRTERVHPRLRLVHRSCDSARIRRRWNAAVDHCGFKHPIPITKIVRAQDGYQARIQVGKGISLRDIQIQKERLAATMGIGELWLDRDPANAAIGTAILTIVVPSDYLAEAAKAEWPLPKSPRRRG